MKSVRSFYFALFGIVTILVPYVTFSQNNVIKFSDDLSWSAILAKAKAERKYIFMDCYATWCAPCKYMSQQVFTQKFVGDFFNENFINVSVQMDRTKMDPEKIRSWYADADTIASKYSVNAYPTYLLFSPDGEALSRFSGSFAANDFVDTVKDELKPEKQYYTLLNKCKDHLGDSGFLKKTLQMAIDLNDRLNTAIIADYYLATLKDSFSIDNLRFLMQADVTSKSELFQFFLGDARIIDKILGRENEVEALLCHGIRDEQVEPLFKSKETIIDFNYVLSHLQKEYPTLANILPSWINDCFKHFIRKEISVVIYENDTNLFDWEILTKRMQIRFPDFNCRQIIDEMRPEYYKTKRMWSECEKSALYLLARYGDQLDPLKINNITWEFLFMNSSNPNALKIALKWSKHTVDIQPTESIYIDTYANLLYKTGERQKALEWEKKALEHCGQSDEEAIRANFEKMEKGEKTWAQPEHFMRI